MLQLLLGVAVSLAASWLLLIAALLVWRPRGVDLREAKRFVPDLLRLLRALAGDGSLPAGVRRRLSFVLGYLALPFDLIPDVVPVLGYADDVIVVALVLRSVIRRAGAEAVDRHWGGSDVGRGLVHRLAGLAPDPA